MALGLGAFVVSMVPLARRRERVFRRTVPVMGTLAELAVVHRDPGYAQGALDAAVLELQTVHGMMTRYTSASDVGRANAAAGERPVPVNAATAYVVSRSLAWARHTDGAFDPALGRAVELWDFDGSGAPPAETAWRRFAGRGLYRKVEVGSDRGADVLYLSDGDVSLDLGGIAKGYGVDRAAEALRDWGIRSGLVNVGGDLFALGASPDGDAWRVGVRDPNDPSGVIAELAVSDAAVATSGDYQRYYDYGGRRYHHLLDPRTGAPRVTTDRSLTVQAERCLDADAAATAVFGVSPTEAERFLEASGSGARIIHRV